MSNYSVQLKIQGTSGNLISPGNPFTKRKHEPWKAAMNRYRKTQQGGGLFSAIEHEQAVAAKTYPSNVAPLPAA
jgi:hypothetical protein